MKIDFEKRRRVMERSQALGHCICDARRPCPCDLLRTRNLCPCAGERPDRADFAEIRLTTFAHNAGCASKIAPADLERVLGRLPAVRDPAVLSGLAAGDDAAIYRIADDLCLVQTVDVFTPCVDDPRTFGRICAVNCLSDIYAMGGEPRTALSILAFPSEKLPEEIMFELLAGAMDVFDQAGVALVGGHSIKDEEVKLGFAITGLINPAEAAALETARPGDALVLTKPLGTGVLTFGQQIGRGHALGLAAAETSMCTLNKAAAEAMKEAGASACTDVTGFGLFVHLLRLMRQGGLAAEVFADALPALDGALESFRGGIVPGAVERNREYAGGSIRIAPDVDEARVNLGFDAQTSGGLLIAIQPGRLEQLLQSLARRGARGHVIGVITGLSAGEVRVAACRPTALQPEPELNPMHSTKAHTHSENCCADVFQAATGADAGTAAESQRGFGMLMRSAQSAGALDWKTKELILFAQVVQSRCEACFEAHYRKARDMGITQSELDEAAWCAIAMGGAPVKMFYDRCLEQQKVNTKGR